MKKLFHYINKEAGFFFPYVMFITGFVLLIISTSIHIYQQEIAVTKRHLDQYKIETLYQIGIVQIKEQIEGKVKEGTKQKFVYPDGSIVFKILEFTGEGYILSTTVYTGNSEYKKKIYIEYDKYMNNNN